MGRISSACAVLLWAATALAADRGDTSESGADVADLFAWMSPDGARLNLAMTVVPGPNPAFSPFVQYVFHLDSRGTFADLSSAPTQLLCQFDELQRISCWLGDNVFVAGDASGNDGLTDPTGALRVFAGVRDDPFFFNEAGVLAMLDELARLLPLAVVDAAGCPTFPPGMSSSLVALLLPELAEGPPVDAFGAQSVMAIVVSLDRARLTRNGSLVSVWASTHRRAP